NDGPASGQDSETHVSRWSHETCHNARTAQPQGDMRPPFRDLQSPRAPPVITRDSRGLIGSVEERRHIGSNAGFTGRERRRTVVGPEITRARVDSVKV